MVPGPGRRSETDSDVHTESLAGATQITIVLKDPFICVDLRNLRPTS